MVGIVGAGGIGGALFAAFLRYEYGFVATILATVIAIIVLGELVVNGLRKVLDV
jgi:phosphonate transport system permease protein